MKIDLHVHTRISSPCSKIDPRDMVTEARRKGLDAVCVTEHDSLEGAAIAKKIGEEMGYLVLGGVEINTFEGDFVVFGLDAVPPCRLHAQELLDLVNEVGGVAIVAHPYRPFDRAVGDRVFALSGYHVLEVLNGNTPPEGNQRASEVALELGIPRAGGSDSHKVEEIGVYYTEFQNDILNESDLIRELKSGRFMAKQWQEGDV